MVRADGPAAVDTRDRDALGRGNNTDVIASLNMAYIPQDTGPGYSQPVTSTQKWADYFPQARHGMALTSLHQAGLSDLMAVCAKYVVANALPSYERVPGPSCGELSLERLSCSAASSSRLLLRGASRRPVALIDEPPPSRARRRRRGFQTSTRNRQVNGVTHRAAACEVNCRLELGGVLAEMRGVSRGIAVHVHGDGVGRRMPSGFDEASRLGVNSPIIRDK
jgi:hypothetical protein